ncbi:MAG: DUF3794 domain-containing protein [Eubacterium ventriosum]|uniref:DUF3794 and LysM peptidoglycan-binding domain-containing protein n=1 Tax=Eubacterium ventriosum TaxID=39496 RepID=UPI001D73A873|nr:SPOCS domain-containing protein [Eubacterium ventriosum]MBD9055439.1 DUF3794 domain-containing protein [Eubacterium ventriosum]
MRLEKKNIHMNKIVKSETVIFFVSREERIMDADNEIENIINQKEIVTTDGVVTRENQITVNGTINYNILYYPKNSEIVCGEEKEINFEENIKLMGINSEDNANVTMEVLSSSIKPVDGKNYIYRIQLKAYIVVEKIEDLDVATAIDTDSQGENYENNFAKENSGKNNVENIMTKKRNIDSLAIMADKTDTFRVSEQIAVPHGKPPIGTIVWSDIRIKNQNIKTMEGSIIINGQLSVFIIYIPEMENMPEQWLEQTIDFNGQLEMSEATEDVVSYIELWLNNVNVQPEINQDNEMRNLSVSALLKLNVKLYKETSINVIEDVYKPGANLVPIMEPKTYQKLLVKNASRTKEVVKMKIDKTKGQLLQICNSQAEIKIENILVRDNSLKAIGKIKTCIIYISSDDRHPICCQCRESNFEHGIDAEGIEGNDEYFLNWKVEQVNANMLNADEVEIKAVIALEAIVFKKVEQNFVTEINQEPVDMEALNSAPVLKGYIVQKGDTLWKLAKENYTTIEKIMTVNNLENETIKKGDRLLIIKSCQA